MMTNLDLPRCKKCGWALLPAMGKIRDVAYYCGNKNCSESTVTVQLTSESANPMTGPCGEPGCDCGHAIEQLQAENARLREALKTIINDWHSVPDYVPVPNEINVNEHWEQAEAALAGKETK